MTSEAASGRGFLGPPTAELVVFEVPPALLGKLARALGGTSDEGGLLTEIREALQRT